MVFKVWLSAKFLYSFAKNYACVGMYNRCEEHLNVIFLFDVRDAGFIPERGFAGFPQFDKMPHKIYVGAENGALKIVPKDKSLFSEIKFSKALQTIILI